MDICTLIGKNIRKLRHSYGWSQEELAFEAGIDRSYLSEVENGQKNVGILVLDQIANALEIPITELLKGYK